MKRVVSARRSTSAGISFTIHAKCNRTCASTTVSSSSGLRFEYSTSEFVRLCESRRRSCRRPYFLDAAYNLSDCSLLEPRFRMHRLDMIQSSFTCTQKCLFEAGAQNGARCIYTFCAFFSLLSEEDEERNQVQRRRSPNKSAWCCNPFQYAMQYISPVGDLRYHRGDDMDVSAYVVFPTSMPQSRQKTMWRSHEQQRHHHHQTLTSTHSIATCVAAAVVDVVLPSGFPT